MPPRTDLQASAAQAERVLRPGMIAPDANMQERAGRTRVGRVAYSFGAYSPGTVGSNRLTRVDGPPRGAEEFALGTFTTQLDSTS
jgi:hypothetical protein